MERNPGAMGAHGASGSLAGEVSSPTENHAHAQPRTPVAANEPGPILLVHWLRLEDLAA